MGSIDYSGKERMSTSPPPPPPTEEGVADLYGLGIGSLRFWFWCKHDNLRHSVIIFIILKI